MVQIQALFTIDFNFISHKQYSMLYSQIIPNYSEHEILNSVMIFLSFQRIFPSKFILIRGYRTVDINPKFPTKVSGESETMLVEL